MAKELRIKSTELRTVEGSDGYNIEGYVNAVGRESELLYSPVRNKWFKEIMEPGVFKRSLEKNTDIPMLLEHDETREVARTSEGTLELSEDSIGLKFKATINDKDLYDSISNGEINSCSFGFVCQEDEFEFVNNKQEKRYVKDISLLEVSLVKNPAYVGSLVEARNMEMALQELNTIGKEEKPMDKTKEEQRAYCSRIWDTQDAINCCLEIMACATSLLTYEECKDAEMQTLTRDILTKFSSYMISLTGAQSEERAACKTKSTGTKETKSEDTKDSTDEKKTDSKEDSKETEKDSKSTDTKDKSEKTDKNEDTDEKKSDEDKDQTEDRALDNEDEDNTEDDSDDKKKDEEESDDKEDNTDDKDEKVDNTDKSKSKEEKPKDDKDEKRGLSPEDELLLIQAELNILK